MLHRHGLNLDDKICVVREMKVWLYDKSVMLRVRTQEVFADC